MDCLFFHRVLASSRIEDYSDGLDPTAGDLAAMLRRLLRRRRFVSSAELGEALRHGDPPDPRWMHLSCDDGFESSLLAAEICADLGVPLTVFISSRVLTGLVPWFVTMRHALASAERKLSFDGDAFDPGDPRQAILLNNRIKAEVYASGQSPEEALAPILERLGCAELPPLPEKHRFLDARGAAGLVSLGAEVGGHGATHRSLQGLTQDELRLEVEESREALEAACGVAPLSFSYPEGLFDEASKAAVQQAGFTLAFTVNDCGPPLDRFALPRQWLGRNLEAVGRRAVPWAFELWGRARSRLARAW